VAQLRVSGSNEHDPPRIPTLVNVPHTLALMTDEEPTRSNVDPRARIVAIVLILALIATAAPFLASVIF